MTRLVIIDDPGCACHLLDIVIEYDQTTNDGSSSTHNNKIAVLVIGST